MEIDITIHEEIDGMIAQKFNDGINNIILILVYLDLEGKVVYLLKKSTKLQRSKILLKNIMRIIFILFKIKK